MKPAAAVLAGLLGWIYLMGAASFPVKWEEPRRALVAQEMIHSGDYLVPRLLGEPYLNKPPLQNWLIVLVAQGEASAVGPWTVRLVTFLALAATAVLLWRLGLSTIAAPHPLPALMFLTTAMVVQYGRTGELDALFTLWVAAGLAAFEIGRRRGSPFVQWTVSQAALGLGVLTKGLSPVFFYPPVLYLAWRRRREVPFSATAFALGLLALAAIVALWLVPYSSRAPAAALGERMGDEVAIRVLPRSASALAAHLLGYPLVLLGAAAPWSLLALGLFSARVRGRLRAMVADPWLELCLASVLWTAALFAFVGEALPRYLMPALPAACVLLSGAVWPPEGDVAASPWRRWLSHPAGFAALAVAFAVVAVFQGHGLLAELPAADRWTLLVQVAALGLVACAAGFFAARRSPAVGWLLSLGLLYGIVWAGLLEPRTAERNRRYVRAAEALASAIVERRPVVCAATLDRKLSYALARRLDRPLRERPPNRTHYFVGAGAVPPPGGSLVREAEGFTLWRVAMAR